ncbi:MAG: LacI family transcriptional regulator [Anaerolineae bacterium]|nr:LacI family transcriptional regulator [Anaerolineae bacterium]
MTGRAKLIDVAELAGVSIGTASQALNNKSNVASETRQRVLAAAEKLGYLQSVRIPNHSQQNISTIGVLMKKNWQENPFNPFYSYVLSGAERECQRQNLSMMYASIEVDEYSKAQAWPPMLDQELGGLMIVGALLEETVAEIGQETGLPIVLVDGYTTTRTYDSILIDNITGAFNAVSYLIENGHQHIGLIGSTPNAHPSIRERRKGYQRALKAHGLEENACIEDGLLNRDAGYQAALQLLKRAPEITAIFSCNDETAIGVFRAAREMGYQVPHDLSVIGFDDIDLTQEMIPPLTTMHVDKVMMGALGVRHLIERARDPNQPTLTTLLGTQLMVRESVRRL